jgi:hypothetical protein
MPRFFLQALEENDERLLNLGQANRAGIAPFKQSSNLSGKQERLHDEVRKGCSDPLSDLNP